RIGSWFERVRESFTGVEPDEFPYELHRSPKFIALRRGNTTWFHFPEGLPSDAVNFLSWKKLPRRVCCLNSGKALLAEETYIPSRFRMETGRAEELVFHVPGIPVDDFPAEPIILRIDW
ncbi:MAG: hypothetical protein J6S59_04445, partial [Clostridia bacterium]|nr:hypothetical protein [Clostridia bacterium]